MIIEITKNKGYFTIGVGDFLKQSKKEGLDCSSDGPYFYNYFQQEDIEKYFDKETSKLILDLKDDETINLASKNFVKIKNDEEYLNLNDSEDDEEFDEFGEEN